MHTTQFIIWKYDIACYFLVLKLKKLIFELQVEFFWKKLVQENIEKKFLAQKVEDTKGSSQECNLFWTYA